MVATRSLRMMWNRGTIGRNRRKLADHRAILANFGPSPVGVDPKPTSAIYIAPKLAKIGRTVSESSSSAVVSGPGPAKIGQRRCSFGCFRARSRPTSQRQPAIDNSWAMSTELRCILGRMGFHPQKLRAGLVPER